MLVSDQDDLVKITDFGLARCVEDKPYYRMMVGGQSVALPLMW